MLVAAIAGDAAFDIAANDGNLDEKRRFERRKVHFIKVETAIFDIAENIAAALQFGVAAKSGIHEQSPGAAATDTAHLMARRHESVPDFNNEIGAGARCPHAL